MCCLQAAQTAIRLPGHQLYPYEETSPALCLFGAFEDVIQVVGLPAGRPPQESMDLHPLELVSPWAIERGYLHSASLSLPSPSSVVVVGRGESGAVLCLAVARSSKHSTVDSPQTIT